MRIHTRVSATNATTHVSPAGFSNRISPTVNIAPACRYTGTHDDESKASARACVAWSRRPGHRGLGCDDGRILFHRAGIRVSSWEAYRTIGNVSGMPQVNRSPVLGPARASPRPQ